MAPIQKQVSQKSSASNKSAPKTSVVESSHITTTNNKKVEKSNKSEDASTPSSKSSRSQASSGSSEENMESTDLLPLINAPPRACVSWEVKVLQYLSIIKNFLYNYNKNTPKRKEKRLTEKAKSTEQPETHINAEKDKSKKAEKPEKESKVPQRKVSFKTIDKKKASKKVKGTRRTIPKVGSKDDTVPKSQETSEALKFAEENELITVVNIKKDKKKQ